MDVNHTSSLRCHAAICDFFARANLFTVRIFVISVSFVFLPAFLYGATGLWIFVYIPLVIILIVKQSKSINISNATGIKKAFKYSLVWLEIFIYFIVPHLLTLGFLSKGMLYRGPYYVDKILIFPLVNLTLHADFRYEDLSPTQILAVNIYFLHITFLLTFMILLFKKIPQKNIKMLSPEKQGFSGALRRDAEAGIFVLFISVFVVYWMRFQVFLSDLGFTGFNDIIWMDVAFIYFLIIFFIGIGIFKS